MKKTLLLAALLSSMAWGQTRPRDPFIFRTAIDDVGGNPSNKKNRLVALLLNANFTALYSTATGAGGGLYLARSGTALDGNTTYAHAQFGQCLVFSGGTVFHRNTTVQLWEIQNNTVAVASQTIYKGFTLTNAAGTTASLRYDIIAGSTTVHVEESPEFIAGGNGSLRRTLLISGLGFGQSLRLILTGTTAVGESWVATSGGTITGTNPQSFTITANGTSVVTGSW